MASPSNVRFEFGRVLGKIWYTLTSRKFLAAFGATFVTLGDASIPPEASATAIAAVWIAFIFGTALEDGLKGK